jgi:hypothetical protein
LLFELVSPTTSISLHTHSNQSLSLRSETREKVERTSGRRSRINGYRSGPTISLQR